MKKRVVIYAAVNQETSYGKRVTECLQVLQDRLGLSVSKLIQDALIAYEKDTRHSVLPYYHKEEDHPEAAENFEAVVTKQTENESLLSALQDESGYPVL